VGETAQRLAQLGLTLPAPLVVPPGVRLPFRFVRVSGHRAFVSGHSATNPDGTLAPLLGKVGQDLTVAQANEAARLTGLAILRSLTDALGDLDRIRCWTRVFGMVNSAPGFQAQPAVINGFSDLILEIFGPDRGAHARSAVGMAELPFNVSVEIEAELEVEAG
jgi:enamine deaminase RidA (YjgF/YER057c/UK114 family)